MTDKAIIPADSYACRIGQSSRLAAYYGGQKASARKQPVMRGTGSAWFGCSAVTALSQDYCGGGQTD